MKWTGVDLGSLLIKRAAKAMAAAHPSTLRRFVTLSPIPGFRNWLDAGLSTDDVGSVRLQPAEVNGLLLLFPAAPGNGRLALRQLLDEISWVGLVPGRCEEVCAKGATPPVEAPEAEALSRSSRRASAVEAAARPVLWRLCGVYLLEETRLRPHIAVAQAVDPGSSS